MSLYMQAGNEMVDIANAGGGGSNSPRLVNLYKTLTGSGFSDPIALCYVWETENMYVCRIIGYWEIGDSYIRFSKNDFPNLNYTSGDNGCIVLKENGNLIPWDYDISSGGQGIYLNISSEIDFYTSKYFCLKKA